MLYNILNNHLSDTVKSYVFWDSEGTNAIIEALDYSLITNSLAISTVHYAKTYPIEVKRISHTLSQLGFINSVSTAKYSQMQLLPNRLLEFTTQEEINEYKIDWNMEKYLLKLDTEIYPDNLVKTHSGIKPTGIRRAGFAKVAKNQFKFDRVLLAKYREPIILDLIKSIEQSIEKGKIKDKFFCNPSNYTKIVGLCVDYYINNDKSFNLEKNVSDQRGRAIFQALRRIFNPITSKNARALLVASDSVVVTPKSVLELDDIYYFIAELAGTKSKKPTESSKIFAGKVAYKTRRLHKLDLSVSDDRDNLHENIWLERIYDMLDTVYSSGSVQWNIPLEVDASQSIAQFVGALTNEIRLMERTNMVGDTLSDPWRCNGVPRLSVKFVGTPRFYGSSASASKLLRSRKVAPVQSHISAINKMFATGSFSIMAKMKDCIVSNYTNHKPVIDIKIWNETFKVECSRMKAIDAKIIVTEAWNSTKKKFTKSITREPIYVPDYEYFSLYWQTCIIHNLDSQVMNKIALAMDEWMLTIHDAIIALPGTCGRARGLYANQLQQINANRFSIMRDYRESIGATSIKADMDFMDLYNMVHQAPANTVFKRTAMK